MFLNGMKQALFSNLTIDEMDKATHPNKENPELIGRAMDHARGTISSHSDAVKGETIFGTIKELNKYKKPEDNKDNNKGFFDKILDRFQKNDNPDEDTLYKQDKEIPEAEIQKLNKYANYDAKDMGLRQRMNNKVGGWYKSVYGDEPQKQDATGRPIQPQPKFALPEESKTISSKDGVGISDSYKRLAQSMSEVDKSGLGGVKALQSSLNGFEDDYDRLKEDGDLGPKTTSRTKYALVNYGLKPVEERIKKSIF